MNLRDDIKDIDYDNIGKSIISEEIENTNNNINVNYYESNNVNKNNLDNNL